jgi:hypothetical protein
VYGLNISLVKAKASFISDIQSFVSTGSQTFAVYGSQLGGSSLSLSLRIADSSSPYTAWRSDSCAQCKSGSGNGRSRKTNAIAISVDMQPVTSGLEYSAAKAILQYFNMSNTTNTSGQSVSSSSHFVFEGRGLGCVQEPGYSVIFEGSSCALTVWTSDSRIECDYVWPISRDRALLSVALQLLDANKSSSVSSDFLTNPVFIPASKPISDTFVSAVFLPMPADVVNFVTAFARLGPIFGLPATADASNTSVVQYSEILDADLLFFCNHTQVYLRNFQPVPVDIAGNISLIAASNGSYIDAPICFGSRTVSHTLPSNSFATVSRVSVAFCPKSTIRAVALRLKFSVLNETGVPIDFPVDSHPFDLIVGRLDRKSVV